MDEDVADRVTALLKENPGCNGVVCVPGASPWMVGYTPQLAVTVLVREQEGAAIDADLPRAIWQSLLVESQPTGQVCTGSPACMSSMYRLSIPVSAESRDMPRSSSSATVSRCHDDPVRRARQRCSITPR